MESYLLWSGTIHMTAKCRASGRKYWKHPSCHSSFESKKLWLIRGWLWPPPTCPGLAALPDQGGGVQLLSQVHPQRQQPWSRCSWPVPFHVYLFFPNRTNRKHMVTSLTYHVHFQGGFLGVWELYNRVAPFLHSWPFCQCHMLYKLRTTLFYFLLRYN